MNGLLAVENTCIILFMATLALKGGLHVYDLAVLWRLRRGMR